MYSLSPEANRYYSQTEHTHGAMYMKTESYEHYP